MRTGAVLLLLAAGTVAVAPQLRGAMRKQSASTSGTVRLTATQVSAGVGWAWGQGTLSYRGKRYRFDVSGLTAIGVGASRADVTGEVHDLERLSDFEGTYTSIEASGAIGGGAGIATMKNANGVRMTLHSTSQGISFQAGPEGINVTLKH